MGEQAIERLPAPADELGAPDPAPATLQPLRVLVIDDEVNIRSTLALCLEQLGCQPFQAATGGAALGLVRREDIQLAFLDMRLGTEDGVELLPSLLAVRPDLDVIIVTAYSSVHTAVEAMRRGARDYLPKPFTPAQIRQLIQRTERRRALEPRVPTPGGDFTAEEVEREHVTRVLARTPTLAEASRILGFDVTTLWRKRKRWGR